MYDFVKLYRIIIKLHINKSCLSTLTEIKSHNQYKQCHNDYFFKRLIILKELNRIN